MSLLPVFLKLTARRSVVIGAGEVALGKIHSLLDAEAAVQVIAPEALPKIQELANAGRIVWLRRAFDVHDVDGAFLVIAATSTAAVNQVVYRSAVERGILCNAVDDPPHCDFYFGSVVRRGDLQIAISTAGESPALAQRLRREIDEQLPQDLGPWLASLGQLRREVLAAYPAGEERKLLLHQLAQRPVCELAACPTRQLAFNSAGRSAVSE
ncbi:MAG TPA: bifunctional precorrin-2 dehydrogenase/sirohydrochlorin ferrochelatase [Acidisarcina sp.]|nr:bifunctional precorrin-2 dehydrogenase/sirohydrochlorin ferrochelatase [Acidisarcina sp.]